MSKEISQEKEQEGEEEKRESFEWMVDGENNDGQVNKIIKERQKQLELLNTKPIKNLNK